MGIELVFALIATFGIPLLGIGVIFRLVEWSWEKRRGTLGSGFFLAVGGILCLPLVLWIAWAVIATLIR
jgi:hypothetical protein